ncbi:hypothetical protein [Paenibacillus abyssi]|uniref:Uncharacterized protein n=1 Tax=Paenibacillus abyssi TaxID=1340531 RepID=A0A917FMI3_9BACL|nr:hypothetical protein [Paenibacillus abyssi]GGF91593.1 hypothetical protein GCM10010916_06100 [Paenibacillus abyssi]
MLSIFLGIVCCYVFAGIAVHIALYYTGKKTAAVRHYVLIGDNHQLQMEWYIRSIRWFSVWSGAPVKITVIDEGSTDETAAIVHKLSQKRDDLSLRNDAIERDKDRAAIMDEDHEQILQRREELSEAAGSSIGKSRFTLKDPDHYMWMLQEEGIVSSADHAVLVDLRQQDQLAKLPL